MEKLLEMCGITKRFPGVVALDNVNLTVYRGEVHALIGENGAGKSTLMKIMNGVYQPTEGKIFVKGQEVRIENVKKAQNLGISIVFQELNLCGHLSVANNIFLGRLQNKHGIVNDRYLYSEAKRILDMLELDIDPNTQVRRLSVAEKQMIEIAKAVSQNADVIVFDEPTSSLTEKEIDHLFRVISMLRSQNKGICYISHRMEELERIADRVTVLRDGQYIDTFNYCDTTIDQLIKLMVGRELEDKYPKYKRKIGDVILKVKNVKRKGVVDVDGFELRKGEILGVAGLVGSGRTETMRIIFGADKYDSAQIWLEGKEVSFKSPKQAIENGVAYLTEDRKENGLALSKDVLFNINMASHELVSRNGIIDDKKMEENAKKYVELLAIKTPSLYQKTMNLSGGNMQKVVLGKWLCRNAKVMIFDEPTRGIDVGAKYEIYKLMNELSDKGISIIMISSELPEVLGMSDRVLIFRDGKISGVLEAEEADQIKILELATGVARRKE